MSDDEYLSFDEALEDAEQGKQLIRLDLEEGDYESLRHFAELIFQRVTAPEWYIGRAMFDMVFSDRRVVNEKMFYDNLLKQLEGSPAHDELRNFKLHTDLMDEWWDQDTMDQVQNYLNDLLDRAQGAPRQWELGHKIWEMTLCSPPLLTEQQLLSVLNRTYSVMNFLIH